MGRKLVAPTREYVPVTSRLIGGYEDSERSRLYFGDCLEILPIIPADSVDSCVVDPPYGLEFMGNEWDTFKTSGAKIEKDAKSAGGYGKDSETNENAFAAARVRHGKLHESGAGVELFSFHLAWLREVYRVLKPGGFILAFGGSRTYHWLGTAMEIAGFEVRDMVEWIYGTGFPKTSRFAGEGKGTALKPAHEPICMARKPFKGSLASNLYLHNTGALNIADTRIERDEDDKSGWHASGTKTARQGFLGTSTFRLANERTPEEQHRRYNGVGRWPSNVIMDEEAGRLLDAQSGVTKSIGGSRGGKRNLAFGMKAQPDFKPGLGDTGGASRFFYCPKPTKAERDLGLDDFPESKWIQFQTANGTSGKASSISEGRNTKRRNTHPTVKPIKLMRYLCRLVTPYGGVILDPMAGSGSTGCGAIAEGFFFVGIEKELPYFQFMRARIKYVTKQNGFEIFPTRRRLKPPS